MNANRKAALGRRCASENNGFYIDGPWPVNCLRHHKGDPLCVAIVQYILLGMVNSGSLKAIDDAIHANRQALINQGLTSNNPRTAVPLETVAQISTCK